MSWLELSVEADHEAVESVSELLAQYGYNGGVVVDRPIIPGPDGPEFSYDMARPVTLRTYLPLDAQSEELRARIEQALWHLGRMRPVGALRVAQIEEQDWANAWKQHYSIQKLGARTVIVPSWLEYAPQDDDLVLRLDPGMAFGTGLHPTTRLCLALLETYTTPGTTALDLGCGSGILAIQIAKLGAARVLALDTDPIAVEATRENAARNGVATQVLAEEGSLGVGASFGHWLGAGAGQGVEDQESGRMGEWETGDRRQGTGDRGRAAGEQESGEPAAPKTPDSAALPTFDLIAANILAKVHVALGDDYATALRPGGLLVSSGIFIDREDEVALAFAAANLERIARRQEGDWVALVHRRL